MKTITILIISFTAGAMLAHARYQPAWNNVAEVEAEIDAYRESEVIGYVRMDEMGQLYYEEK